MPPVAATVRRSLVIENLIDIIGLGMGASATGDCNAVTWPATAAAIAGVDNESPPIADASVSAVTGEPINGLEIVDQCPLVIVGEVDMYGLPRVGSTDRGAIEVM